MGNALSQGFQQIKTDQTSMFLDPKFYIPFGLGIVLIFASIMIATNSCDEEETCDVSNNKWVSNLMMLGILCMIVASFLATAFHFNAVMENEAAKLVFGT